MDSDIRIPSSFQTCWEHGSYVLAPTSFRRHAVLYHKLSSTVPACGVPRFTQKIIPHKRFLYSTDSHPGPFCEVRLTLVANRQDKVWLWYESEEPRGCAEEWWWSMVDRVRLTGCTWTFSCWVSIDRTRRRSRWLWKEERIVTQRRCAFNYCSFFS